jgi:hypothetical protein
MKDYIKPTIKLASTISDTGTSVTCSNTAEDMQLIKDLTGVDDVKVLFGIGEGCSVEVDMYCKFTSVEVGNVQVFIS